MPVRYTPPTPRTRCCPFPASRWAPPRRRSRSGTVTTSCWCCAIPGTVAAGVFTQNRFAAAPVLVCREHLATQARIGSSLRALPSSMRAMPMPAPATRASPMRAQNAWRSPRLLDLRARGSAAVFHRRHHGAAARPAHRGGPARRERCGARRRLVRGRPRDHAATITAGVGQINRMEGLVEGLPQHVLVELDAVMPHHGAGRPLQDPRADFADHIEMRSVWAEKVGGTDPCHAKGRWRRHDVRQDAAAQIDRAHLIEVIVQPQGRKLEDLIEICCRTGCLCIVKHVSHLRPPSAVQLQVGGHSA